MVLLIHLDAVKKERSSAADGAVQDDDPRALAAVGSLVMEIAHQLKNPLFAISAALDAFEERTGNDPSTARHRAILRHQVRRILALVQGLQEYARGTHVEVQATDLGDVLRRVAAELNDAADGRGVHVVTDLAPGADLRLEADPIALGRAFGRVTENAVQYSPRDGVVRLSAVRRDEAEGACLVVTVEDAGPGFLSEDLERVFEPLFSRRSESSGLGLAIARQIVRLHGGDVEAGASSLGGARVTVRLPA